VCGIAGALSRTPEAELTAAVLHATRALAHRGPDGEGFWRAGPDGSGLCSAEDLARPASLVLGHRRLSIVDLDGGAQPMANEDRSVWVAFNGEIYNQLELRRKLERVGHRFRTRADTEVLVHGWEEWRDELFGQLNGIFAFALVDERTREVFLVRDPLGVKPLYVGTRGRATWWSSELGAAREAGLAAEPLSPEGLKLYLMFGFVPSPETVFAAVSKIPPGHFVRLAAEDAGKAPDFQRYVSHVYSSAQPTSARDWQEALIAELDAAVKRQLMADVPVASLLSGGVDSTLVTRMMARHLSYRPHAFGIGFRSDGEESEAVSASLAARELGVPHTSVLTEDDAYIAAWPAAVRRIGEPIANPGALLVHLLCEQVGRSHKVVLTGQGADEPLGGYPRHTAERLHLIGRHAPLLSRGVARLLLGGESAERLNRVLAAADRVERYVQIFSLLPTTTVDALVPNGPGADELARASVTRWVEGDTDTLNELLRIDARMSLADNLLLVADHFSMTSSVELRVPFLDLELVELVERMPSRFKVSLLGDRKWLYRRAAVRQLPLGVRKRLSGPIVRLRRKRGFETPLEAWFESERGPLALAASWLEPLSHLEGFDTAAVQNHDVRFARQRMALFSLARWAEPLTPSGQAAGLRRLSTSTYSSALPGQR
jgi:asparagine synthase (glutamine-hydrolysing)